MGEIKQLQRKNLSPRPWRVVVEKPFKNCEKLHPLAQRKTALILDAVCEDEAIQRITIFGSGTTRNCHVESDLDIFIEATHKPTLPLVPFVYDLWTKDMVDERLLGEIKKKGVVVFERE